MVMPTRELDITYCFLYVFFHNSRILHGGIANIVGSDVA